MADTTFRGRPVDVLNPRCPSRAVLDLVADTWSLLVLHDLAGVESRRYGELHRSVGGISQKMLTQTLRRLEANGLVTRTVYERVPPHVDYALTDLGRSLHEVTGAMCRWAQVHLPDVVAAREATAGGGDGAPAAG